MEDNQTNMTPKTEKAMAALLLHPTVRAASVASSIPEPTLYRMLRNQVFKAEYDRRRKEALDNAVTALQSATGGAVETMTAIMYDAGNPASVRLNAAKSILELAIRAKELYELEERLSALESRLQEQGK